MRDFSNYIAKLPANHVEALHKICSDFFEMHAQNVSSSGSSWSNYKRHEYQMFFRVSSKFVSTFALDFKTPESLSGNQKILEFFNDFDVSVSAWLADQFFEHKYAPLTDSIQLGKKKSQQIQEKTNELRDVILGADYLDEKHQRSLLLRLEKFQAELHKAISSMDVFLAAWGDINDMVEDTGNKSKPIVDRFREIISSMKPEATLQIKSDEKPKQLTDRSNKDAEEK